MAATHIVRFPGESAQYREARNALLQAEANLQKQVLAVADMRAALPLGGEVQNYAFTEGGAALDDMTTVRGVSLSDLFAPGQSTLLLYSYMYSPKMKLPCPMCTSFLDGLNGNAHHIRRRASLAVVAKSPIARIRQVARERGWNHLRMLSSEGTTYNADFHAEDEDGGQMPMMTVFVKRGGKIHHFWSTETIFATEEGHEPCHLDTMWPLWNALDLTPEGRGEDWHPALRYEG